MAHLHSSYIWDGAGDTNVTLSQITVLLNGKHTLKSPIVLRMTPLLDSDRFYILTGNNRTNTPNTQWHLPRKQHFEHHLMDDWRQDTNDLSPECRDLKRGYVLQYDVMLLWADPFSAGQTPMAANGNAISLYDASHFKHEPHSVALNGSNSHPFHALHIAIWPHQSRNLTIGLKTGLYSLTLLNGNDAFMHIAFAIMMDCDGSATFFELGRVHTWLCNQRVGSGPSTPALSLTSATFEQSAADRKLRRILQTLH
jgi:hypothetical protein